MTYYKHLTVASGSMRMHFVERKELTACLLPPAPPAPSPASACNPSPCGPFSECRDVGGIPRCSCAPTYVGTPPLCRPECVVNSECQANRACVSRRCVNPCTLACGVDAECRVINHNPVCSCPAQYTGDSLSICFPAPKRKQQCYQSPFSCLSQPFVLSYNWCRCVCLFRC